MGKTVKRRTARTVDPNALARAVEAVAQLVADEGAIPKAVLAKHGVPRAEMARALERLTASGFEVAGKFVRIPLEEQLVAQLSNAALLPLRSIADHVQGATKRDASLAAKELVASKRARFVVRSTEVLLASNDVPALVDRDLDRLEATVGTLNAAIKLARRKGGALLRSDVEEALGAFATTPKAVAPDAASPKAVPPKPTLDGDLRASIREHQERSGLTWVPKLVRALGGLSARDTIHAELLRGARRGELELRPESGMGRLSEEDAALCLDGPQGTRLSWVRTIEKRT